MKQLTQPTPLLDFQHPEIQALIAAKGWRALPPYERIGAAYHYVRDAVAFGYNASDDLPASRVLADGIGQCNTKGTLLMALLRALEIPCRFHGFTIHKALQRGAITGVAYRLAPNSINHDFGVFDSPDDFYARHGVNLSGAKRWLFLHVVRRWMNHNVASIRNPTP